MKRDEHTKELSPAATGLLSGLSIKGKAINGVRKQVELLDILISLRQNIVMIEWEVFLFDNKGNPLPDIEPINKKFYIKDTGESGTVELDPVTQKKKLETFVKTEDEDLSLTEWNNMVAPLGATLGQVVIGAAVDFVTQIEGITA